MNLKLSLEIWILILIDFCRETNFLPILPEQNKSVGVKDIGLTNIFVILMAVIYTLARREADKKEEQYHGGAGTPGN